MNDNDYNVLAVDELDRADSWANKDGVEADFRKRMVDRSTERAMIYSLLSISHEIKMLRYGISRGQ